MSKTVINSIGIYCVIYNRERSIKDSITSLIMNSPSSATIVLVDDCSTDNSLGIMKEFSKHDGRVIVIENKINLGFTKSLINAIDSIESYKHNEYIGIHGAGDITCVDRFNKQVAFLEQNCDYSFVGTSFNVLNEEKIEIGHSKSRGDIIQNDVSKKPPSWTHGTVVYRAEHYFKSGGYDSRFEYCQDWDLYIRLLSIGPGFVIADKLYSKVMFRDGATFSPKKRIKQLKYGFCITEKISPENFNLKNIKLETFLCKEIIRSNISLLKKNEINFLMDWEAYLSNTRDLKFGLIALFINRIILKFLAMKK
ncbi:glycosyltransferase family 2 protein [Vibrio cyclitrophicus]|uniref:glycosyltransferase family 2 protein n=1 Tax=Vibrio cyclitrophicus TaxID=47951 RepID=UPI000C839585|nr:glycosyltransferase family A protein [Vibrio cyclitrophicus]PMF19924.1 hypothetical protein BCV18_07120 [Vibrio cyclitrophicus]